MSKKDKHKKHKHCSNCGAKRRQVEIPVDVVVRKINEELNNGRLRITKDDHGNNMLEIVSDNVESEGHVFESEENAIFASIYDKLDDISVNLDYIGNTFEEFKDAYKYGHAELHDAQAATEPIKVFPDDSITAMVEDLVRDTLSKMVEEGLISVACHACDCEGDLFSNPTDDGEDGKVEPDEKNLLEKVEDDAEENNETRDDIEFLNPSEKDSKDMLILKQLAKIVLDKNIEYISLKILQDQLDITYQNARAIMMLLEVNGIIPSYVRGSNLGRSIALVKLENYIINQCKNGDPSKFKVQ